MLQLQPGFLGYLSLCENGYACMACVYVQECGERASAAAAAAGPSILSGGI